MRRLTSLLQTLLLIASICLATAAHNATVSWSAFGEVQDQSPTPSASAFAGTWVLDRENTKTSKDFPRKLKNYKITVVDNELALNVQSEVDGQVEIEVSRDRAPDNSDIVANTASRTTASSSGGPPRSSTQVTPKAQKITYGGTMAVFFTPNNVTYNLSGEEAKFDIKQGDKVTGTARVKAKLDKRGNQIQFTTIRRMITMKGDIEITIREVWKLSKDGKSLKFERTVETPSARDEIVMTLSKVAAA
ncbi:MAG TPA: hypothetical protein VGW76_15965 [Pyrinomonadaceae bacterium]|nr:hypothetical protein [Pyrinomonadaceae bacterium]